MDVPSKEIIPLLWVFRPAFTAPTFRNALMLVWGTLLAPGRRTVTAALRAMGLGGSRQYSNYHRVLNRAEWSPWVLSRLVLALLIERCLEAEAPLLVVIDETLEQRRGPKIAYTGWFRDPLRSTFRKASWLVGLQWLCLALVVPVPWSQRPWALPFVLVPVLSPKTSAALHKRHRTVTEWAAVLIARVRRWQPERELIVVGDNRYATLPLVATCQGFARPVRLVSRLRLDANLYAPPDPAAPRRSGRPPKKGARLPKFPERLADPESPWQPLRVPWYGGATKELLILSERCLWYRRGHRPLPIRWVLVRCPEETFSPTPYFCSDPSVSPEQLIRWAIARWNIEVTFEELRAHLGVGTQRHWSRRAVERTTPCLFGLFSLVTLFAHTLHPTALPVRQAAWYPKPEATFADALAAVRRHLWSTVPFSASPADPDLLLIPRPTLDALLEVAAYST